MRISCGNRLAPEIDSFLRVVSLYLDLNGAK